MIRRIWRFLTQVQFNYPNPLDRQQARDMLRFALVFLVGVGAGVYIPSFFGVINLSGSVSPLVWLGTPLLSLGLVFLIQRGALNFAKFALIVILLISTLPNVVNGITNIGFLSVFIPIIASSTLLGRRETVLVTLVIIGAIGTGVFTQDSILIRIGVEARLLNFLLMSLIIVFTSLIAITFGFTPQRITGAFSQEVRDLRLVLNSEALSLTEPKPEVLMLTTLNELRDRFEYRFVQLYLLDEQRRTAERYYTGFGLDTLQKGEPIDINTVNAIGECLRTGVQIVVDEYASPTRRRHLSVGMAFGLVLPMRLNNETIGVLDIQSNITQTASPTRLEALQIYADRLAESLTRTRIAQQLRDDLGEQERLIVRQRQRVRELELAQQGVTTSWQTFFEQFTNGIFGYDVDAQTSQTVRARDLPDTLRLALEAGDLVITQENGQQVVSLPVMLRDQLLGAMSFKLARHTELTERQVELLRSVVQRLGLALENKRLFEQSQTQAQRESKANEVASVLLSSTDIDAVLQLASQTFNEALGAISTQIYLQPQSLERTQEATG